VYGSQIHVGQVLLRLNMMVKGQYLQDRQVALVNASVMHKPSSWCCNMRVLNPKRTTGEPAVVLGCAAGDTGMHEEQQQLLVVVLLLCVHAAGSHLPAPCEGVVLDRRVQFSRLQSAYAAA
jgi:hypothetical protein